MASEFTRADAAFPAITLENALQIAITGAALFLRLYALSVAPLNSAEARQALASYNFVQGNEFADAGNPLLFAVNALLFALFTASDFTARLAPALFGTALALLPIFFRRDLGRTGALVASALLAFSPSLVFFSRTLVGAIPAVVLALAAYALYARYRETYIARDLYIAGILAALALLTASLAWFDQALASGSLVDVLRLLLVYEPLIVLFGVGGFVNAFFAGAENRGTLFTPLGISVVVVFVLLAFGGDYNPSRIVFLVVPLSLMAGASIGVWIERMIELARGLGWRELLWHEIPILSVSAGLVSFLSIVLAELAQRGNIVTADALARLFGSSQDNPAFGNSMVILLFLFAFLAAAILALTILGTTRASNAGTLLAFALLSFWTTRQTGMLNYSDAGAYNPQEWIVTRAASSNVRDLVRDLESQSRWRANDTHSLIIVADSSLGPIVAWNLREFRYARFAFRPSVTPETQAWVASSNAPAPPGGWIAQRYRIEMTRGADTGSRLRALIYRDVGTVESTDAVLWVPRP